MFLSLAFVEAGRLEAAHALAAGQVGQVAAQMSDVDCHACTDRFLQSDLTWSDVT